MIQPVSPYCRSWQRRIAAIIFPYHPVPTPSPTDSAKLVSIVPVLCNVSLSDRFRLFFTGRCEVLIKSIVDNGIPSTTISSFAVLPPRDWACDPPPQVYPAVIVVPTDMGIPIQVPLSCPAPVTKFWLQGRVPTADHPSWEIGGIYNDHERAVRACSGTGDFVVPFPINEALNDAAAIHHFPLNTVDLHFPVRDQSATTSA